MYRLLLVLTIALYTLAEGSENKADKNIASHGPTSATTRNNVASGHNITYIEKADNMLRTPNINKYYEKKKKQKRPPKRTVQKIIKKNNRLKMRKVYFSRAKRTTAMPKIDYEKLYGQDDEVQKKERIVSTTRANQRKKMKKKYVPKLSRYHMPFQKMQKKDKRHKRGLSRELYILKDLDEMEFLSKEGDQDVVKAHVKNMWKK